MRIRSNKSQSSVEYLMIIGIALFVFVPLAYVFYSYSQGTTEGIALSRITNIGNTIVNTAESVYYLGEPTRITIEESMPEGIKNLTIAYDPSDDVSELVFLLEDLSEMPFISGIWLNGTFDSRAFTPGLKSIAIASKGDYVQITIE